MHCGHYPVLLVHHIDKVVAIIEGMDFVDNSEDEHEEVKEVQILVSLVYKSSVLSRIDMVD